MKGSTKLLVGAYILIAVGMAVSIFDGRGDTALAMLIAGVVHLVGADILRAFDK